MVELSAAEKIKRKYAGRDTQSKAPSTAPKSRFAGLALEVRAWAPGVAFRVACAG